MSGIETLDWEPPRPGAAVDVVGELRWVRLPVPGPLQHINVWLAPGSAGRVLIDTGLNHPETHAAWQALADREHLRRELVGILVTHDHVDHFGMAAHLAARFGVQVRMSAPARRAAERTAAGASGLSAGALRQYRETWGVNFEEVRARAGVGGAFERYVSGLPPHAPFVQEGERIAELRDPWRASLHFGHAEGHMCLHWPEVGLLISGDQLLPTISSHIGIYPGSGSADPLGDFLDSLECLAKLPIDTLVLPAHGRPFRGVRTRIAQLRAEHTERLARLTDFTAQPREVPEIVARLFGHRPLEGAAGLLAYGETLAHIHYLHARGALSRLAGRGTVHWHRA